MKRMKAEPTAAYFDLLVEVADVVEAARHAAARSVNAVMTATYSVVGSSSTSSKAPHELLMGSGYSSVGA
jgi:hypothetical protein